MRELTEKDFAKAVKNPLMTMKYKQLSHFAEYRAERIENVKVSNRNYVSIENMLPDRGGIERASSLPNAKTLSKYVEGDILLSNIRPYFKKIWFANTTGGCSNDVLVVRPNGVDAKFLFYVLSNNNFFNYSTVTSKGTKMPRGSKTAIMKYLAPDVDTTIQVRIAEILSAYDDAIENNNRRIALLEKAARELYREWFVRFRFPGYENVRFVNDLPEGWEVKKLTKIAKVNPPLYAAKNANEEINYIDISSVDNGRFHGYTKYIANEAPSRARRKIKMYDTIYSTVRPSLKGYRFIVSCHLNAIVSTGFAVIRSKKQYDSAFIYFLLTEQRVVDYFAQIATGTSYPAISGSDIERLKIILPNEIIRNMYWDNVKPMFDKVDKCESQSQNLARQRDLLLPRLMSGKLEVS